MYVYDPIPAIEWGKRLERVMDNADELGKAEVMTPRLKMKHQETMEENRKIKAFLDGLQFLLSAEKYNSGAAEELERS
jgi:hypothetical protein